MTHALTVCQPFASLIAAGHKFVENRTWPTSYRGPLLIHAGKSRKYLTCCDELPGDLPDPLPFGAIVADSELVECINLDAPVDHGAIERMAAVGITLDEFLDHEHTEGPWCWILRDVSPLPEPVPCSGRQQLWKPPHDVLWRVTSQQID